MLTRDLEILAEHHIWAGQRLLDTAALLSPEQMGSGALSHGSLLQTLRHSVDVAQSWRAAAAEEAELTVEEIEEQLVDFASLRSFWGEEDERLLAFVRSLTAADLQREVLPAWKQQTYTIWHILFHIMSHSADVRSEVGWHLRSWSLTRRAGIPRLREPKARRTRVVAASTPGAPRRRGACP